MNLYHLHKGDIGFTLEWTFMCFIRIHKVKPSKYEWCLDLLTEIFDSWIFITNTEETQTHEWIFICFIRIHKANSPKYEWSLDFMTMMFDSWIFITYIKGTQVLFLNDIHVLYQNPQGELFKVWMVFRYVDSDIWQLNLYHKHKRDKKDMHVFYQNPQGEIIKVWMVFRFVDSDIWQLNLHLKHKRDTKVLFMKSIHMFFQNLPGEIFKLWMVFE